MTRGWFWATLPPYVGAFFRSACHPWALDGEVESNPEHRGKWYEVAKVRAARPHGPDTRLACCMFSSLQNVDLQESTGIDQLSTRWVRLEQVPVTPRCKKYTEWNSRTNDFARS